MAELGRIQPVKAEKPGKPPKPAKAAAVPAAAGKARRSPSRRSLARHALVGIVASFGMFGGLVAWAATTDIAGAIVAGGLIAVEGGSKLVQHPEGGIVAEIFVENEDRVEAGQLLVRLDGTTIRANLAVVMSQLYEALARQARLVAESTGATTIDYPEALEAFPDQDELRRLFVAQERLMETRAASLDGQVAQMEEQVAQIELQIVGLESQQDAISGQLEIVNKEAADLEGLLAQGLVQVSRVNDSKREQSRLVGEQGRIASAIASARAAIAERGAAAAQLRDEFLSRVLQDLQDVGVTVAELLQQKIAAEDRLARLDIRAPQAGVIHESIVRTVGGVVGAGETLMMVVPQNSQFLVDARVSPLDIDKIYPGQEVLLRLSSLNARTTPELTGSVRSVSPDLIHDQATGYQYFLVRVVLPEAELAKLPPGIKLSPGMPAEVFAQTGDRTVLSYLFQPLAEQLNRSFRED